MDDDVHIEIDKNKSEMGASGNPNAARLATLQERKKNIEESLAKCTQDLRQICLQEANLTGVVPQEMPLDPGEPPPSVRRRVRTAFQLSENLFKNVNKSESIIADLELKIQVHYKMAEAALGLAKEQNSSKTIKRQHMAEYQQHIQQFNKLQENLAALKEKLKQQQLIQNSELSQKQKKKPRPLEDDNISMSTTANEPFIRSDLRHGVRSNMYLPDEEVETRYPNSTSYQRVCNSVPNYLTTNPTRQEEALARGLYRLSINGYKRYMERRENMTNIHMSSAYTNQQYTQPHISHMSLNHHHVQLSPHQPNQLYQNQRSSQPIFNYHTINQNFNPIPNSPSKQLQQQQQQSTLNRNHKIRYEESPEQTAYRAYQQQQLQHHHQETDNFHQIQPHQQYEQMGSGLGGYWKRSESGKKVWCDSQTEPNWQRDKRFGSLDRRKNKRMHKRVSPSADKSATLASVPYSERVRTASVKSSQMIRRSQDNRQLVRTQSLGSVGAQTIDSVWPSDDTSSENDSCSINDPSQGYRKPKQKEWLETSLDGPVSPTHLSPTHSIISRSHSALPPTVLSPEEKYLSSSSTTSQNPSPLSPKLPLEIPAESNPSPRIPEANIELFNNNNIPRNGTIVQAGHCKPYYEETKPFEMSDFYKYSTKFKKSPVKTDDNVKKTCSTNFQKNLNESFDAPVASPSSRSPYLGGSSMDNSNSFNGNLDISNLSNPNVAEPFSDEMNAWYKSHSLDSMGPSSSSKGKSTATLV